MAGIVISQIDSTTTSTGQGATLKSPAWPWWLPGAIALSVIAALTLLPLATLLLEAGAVSWQAVLAEPYTQRVIRFSLYQALLSTLLSLGLALPVALALAHTPRFRGRTFIIGLFSLSLVIPAIVAIYGIVAVYGRTGWLSHAREFIGQEPLVFYGLSGILIAHVFYNMPLAVRVMVITLESIPQANWRLARQLGMRPMSIWRYIEWPALRRLLPGLSLLIFTLCFTSFAVVMTLGGGPRATTIEVAIYQALRFDYDITQAMALACIQLAICLCLTIFSTLFNNTSDVGFQNNTGLGHAKSTQNHSLADHRILWSGHLQHTVNGLLIISACAFVITPLAALVLSAFNNSTLSVITDNKTLAAILNTSIAALSSAVIAVSLALGLLISARHLNIRLGLERGGQWLQLAGNMILILPPVVLGTGLFLLLRAFADVFSLALILVILINSLMALPFVLRILETPTMRIAKTNDKLIASLGLYGVSRWRYIDFPQLQKPIAFAFAIAATMSAGDLSAIALFGSERVTTLPLLLYQRVGSYRLEEAAVTAGLLLALCMVIFFGLQRLIGGRSDA